MTETISIRWHSRAGQGAITASTALAEILGRHGKFVQSFPDFGAEKRGAPVVVFNRIGNERINDVSHPAVIDAAVLLDPSLLASCEVNTHELLAGLKENGLLLINSPQKKLKMEVGTAQVFALAASAIAVAEIGKDIPNVPILGALVRILELAPMEKFKQDLAQSLGAHLPAEIVAGNLRAFERGFAEVTTITGKPGHKKIVCAKLPGWRDMPLGAAIQNPGSSRHYATGNWSHQTCEWTKSTCINCQLCWPVCPHDAIIVKDGKMLGIDATKCTACGLCVVACPTRPKSLKIISKQSSEI
ncbi:MAG: 2-oxoacid:acceptor oxidoreductase family protein [Patescibacteria group bacterium]